MTTEEDSAHQNDGEELLKPVIEGSSEEHQPAGIIDFPRSLSGIREHKLDLAVGGTLSSAKMGIGNRRYLIGCLRTPARSVLVCFRFRDSDDSGRISTVDMQALSAGIDAHGRRFARRDRGDRIALAVRFAHPLSAHLVHRFVADRAAE